MKYSFFIITFCCASLALDGKNPAVWGKSHPANPDSINSNCTEPVTWRIGSIDSHYNINEASLQNIMADVSKLWSDAIEVELITYSDSGDVALNFIYSDEQRFTEDEQQMFNRINEMRQGYYSKKIKYQQEFSGSPKKMARLSKELNDYADKVNEMIYQYTSRFSEEKTFHQAIYTNVGDQKKINVYQFKTPDKLKLVLAHEFGHALGLQHVDNPAAIMHSRMQLQNDHNLKLTEDDIREIQNRCQS